MSYHIAHAEEVEQLEREQPVAHPEETLPAASPDERMQTQSSGNQEAQTSELVAETIPATAQDAFALPAITLASVLMLTIAAVLLMRHFKKS